MKSYERFLNYVKFDTTSDPKNGNHPSSDCQLVFANYLKDEMIKIGIENVVLTDKCYLYGEIKSNTTKSVPTIGFIAHMDTSCDCSGANINSIIHENYDGKDIILNKEKNIVLSVSDYPFLKEKIGHTIITTDGTTLLGADDKAGISEILTLCEKIITEDFEHGTIKIAFTPDEEIGEGANYFDVEFFNCDYAYTVDGGEIECVEYENFNAASSVVTVNGKNIHPGSAKGKMVNSINIAYEFDSLLPSKARPQYTELYEGFNHLNEINGTVEKTTLNYIIRNHSKILFEKQKIDFLNAQKHLNEKYGDGTINLTIIDSYYNMASELKDKMYIIDNALKAITSLGLTASTIPIRGGTDGARLTFMGLPCPNLGTGGFNCHSRFECISIEDMDKATLILEAIVKDLCK